MGATGLAERQLKARRMLRDDGASYNLDSQPNVSQIWNLDPVPMVLSSSEWGGLERGLLERSELLDLLLKDIYGAQSLIRHKVIPPAALFADRGYLRECSGIQLPIDNQLVLHAADLLRGSDGNWQVIGDRTQTPSGSGFALENRTVLARVMPSLFRDAHVHRLSKYFHALRTTLAQLSTSSEIPRVVMLTAGHHNEAYFEQAYLANYLGYSLVQSGDLTVRDGHVWMKSLSGLSKVDIIMRCIDDDLCDPVAFRKESMIGVPGLLQVVRSGRVTIANPLGSGVLENPLLAKYLPAVARHFLGRDLRINAVPTWWCGNPSELSYVKANFSSLLIRRTRRVDGQHSVFVSSLAAFQRDELLQKVLDNPTGYVAQEPVQPSLAPMLYQQQLHSRPVVMRAFSVASNGSYSIMPGGLTRVGTTDDNRYVSNQAGALSKDTWIISSEPETDLGIRNPDSSYSSENHEDSDLPSRVVESLFWFGRYAERAESSIRLLRVAFDQISGIEPLPAECRKLLLHAVSHTTGSLPGFTASDADLSNPDKEFIDLITNPQRQGSIASCLYAMLATTDSIRELLSTDMQRLCSDIRDQLEQLDTQWSDGIQSAPAEALDTFVSSLLALSGLTLESMVRGRAWRFIATGRRLERSQRTIELIRAMLVTPAAGQDIAWVLDPTLSSLESLMAYRRQHRGQFDLVNGLNLMLMQRNSPRSLVFQFDMIQKNLKQINGSIQGGPIQPDSRAILKASNALLLAEIENIVTIDPSTGNRQQLADLLDILSDSVSEASQLVADKYFDHSAKPQVMGESRIESGL
jgi:uncharacterized circularly permuted ATP-grasp superfamily protein/uncharacterized alpha-E superfamily protein